MPLGDAYLELIAVADPPSAEQSAFGRWVAAASPGSLLGWAVRTDRLAAVAARLQLTTTTGSRETSDGRLLEWQLAGVDEAIAEPPLPFFIEWGAGTPLPGRAAVDHPAGQVAIAEVVLEADAQRVGDWLGPHAMPVTVRPGVGGVSELRLRGDAGEFALGQ